MNGKVELGLETWYKIRGESHRQDQYLCEVL